MDPTCNEYKDLNDELVASIGDESDSVQYLDTKDIYLENLDVMPKTATSCAASSRRNRPRSVAEKVTLALFKDKNNKEAKKENIRCAVIRALKRSIRDAINSRIPNCKLSEIYKSIDSSLKAWEKFSLTCIAYKKYVAEVSLTASGPNTDGKSTRKAKAHNKSFNDKFVKDFFSEPFIAELYSLFLDTVFAINDCKILTKRFGLRPIHHIGNSCNDCQFCWDTLKRYLSLDMIIDLYSNGEQIPIH